MQALLALHCADFATMLKAESLRSLQVLHRAALVQRAVCPIHSAVFCKWCAGWV